VVVPEQLRQHRDVARDEGALVPVEGGAHRRHHLRPVERDLRRGEEGTCDPHAVAGRDVSIGATPAGASTAGGDTSSMVAVAGSSVGVGASRRVTKAIASSTSPARIAPPPSSFVPSYTRPALVSASSPTFAAVVPAAASALSISP